MNIKIASEARDSGRKKIAALSKERRMASFARLIHFSAHYQRTP